MLREDLSTEDYKVYVNQNKKDLRYRALLVYADGTRKNISYPRLILEKKLGRELLPEEDVHHIDEDKTNNDPSNLTAILHGEHQKEHAIEQFKDKVDLSFTTNCCTCGKEIFISHKQKVQHMSRVNRGLCKDHYFCSKHCSGLYGAKILKEKQHA